MSVLKYNLKKLCCEAILGLLGTNFRITSNYLELTLENDSAKKIGVRHCLVELGVF